MQDDISAHTCATLLTMGTQAVPLLKGLAPGFYRKRRTAVLLSIRLVMAGCAAVSHICSRSTMDPGCCYLILCQQCVHRFICGMLLTTFSKAPFSWRR